MTNSCHLYSKLFCFCHWVLLIESKMSIMNKTVMNSYFTSKIKLFISKRNLQIEKNTIRHPPAESKDFLSRIY
jgi:hypothetical protein